MESLSKNGHKEQIPPQVLPEEGSVLPSKGTTPEGGPACAGPPDHSMAATRRSKPAAKVEAPRERDPEMCLKAIRGKASQLILDENVRSSDRVIHLRQHEDVKALGLKDAELNQILIQSQAEIDGRPTIRKTDEALSRKPIRWLVEDILIKDGTNLVYAEPKCGKTRFLLALLGALLNKEERYLNKELFDKGEKLLICGPDMTEQTWAEFLEDFGLADAQGQMHERMAGITCAGMNFRLDDAGIDLVEQQARENPGLIVLIDAFASCMWGLGVDENKSQAVDPLMRLINAVAPFRATLIVVHHAKKGTDAIGVSASARGSSAITAVVDQIVSMKAIRKPGTDEETGEVTLQTRGRASKPIALSIRQGSDGKKWESLGSLEEREEANRIEKAGDALTDGQRLVLEAAIRAYADNKTPCTVKDYCLSLGKNPTTQRRLVQKYVDGLVKTKGFLKKAGEVQHGKTKPQCLYLPTQEGLVWSERSLPTF